MKKKFMLSIVTLGLVSALSACSNQPIKVDPNKQEYVVGISQLVRHVALDAATEGFKESLTKELKDKGRTVRYVETNAQGEISLANVTISSLISRNVDLIMANATACFQAAVNATKTIPIVGTSITSYDVALGTKLNDNLIGNNATGTSDLAPLDAQAKMIFDLVPSARDIGLLYCSSEPNSTYQVDTIKVEIEKIAKQKNIDVNVNKYPFVDSNDVDQVARLASRNSDLIYTPTDNTVASASKTIAAATSHGRNGKRTPIICGEEGPCKNTGIATLTISYKDLGVLTGQMAAQILLGEKDVTKMKVEFSKKFTKKYNKQFCIEAGIDIDQRFDGYEEIK